MSTSISPPSLEIGRPSARVALGGCNKNDHTVNVAPENPEPEPTMVNPVMEPDPAEGETPETTAEEPHVNTGPQ